ncbi:hypothetical protein [Corynebacterium auris]|uniref:hypothetical protein n=1 Tax=Corynebacterium auris TaxID=44750 RepID=UPI0025B44970|nr:hypothetical protein [Corynebacterium auris]WJY67385.1 hypothetical protein CAURIS_02305 [Corynebacterium auris]
MTRRYSAGRPSERDGVSAHLQPLADDDAFLTALSRGEDPSGGSDELAALFLQLREEVAAQMPPAPEIDTSESTVVDLGEKRRRRGTSPWLAGLIGAAAATALVAGTGSALYNATPGSPLWGPATAVFGDRAAVVELAGTLEELEAASASGDDAAARSLLDQAQALMGIIGHGEGQDQDAAETPSVTVTERTTAQATPQPAPGSAPAAPAPAPETVTETRTQTVTVTVTPEPPREDPATTQPTPTSAPRPSATSAPSTTVQPSVLQPAVPIAPSAGGAAQ